MALELNREAQSWRYRRVFVTKRQCFAGETLAKGQESRYDSCQSPKEMWMLVV
jgi:hypothetical protein